MKSWCGVPFVIPSSRAAVFVVSPTAVYSIRRSEPTLPDITRAAVEPDAHPEALAEALLAQPVVEAPAAAP